MSERQTGDVYFHNISGVDCAYAVRTVGLTTDVTLPDSLGPSSATRLRHTDGDGEGAQSIWLVWETTRTLLPYCRAWWTK